MLGANQILEPPCKDDIELENHTLDRVVEEIRRKEIYMSEKTMNSNLTCGTIFRGRSGYLGQVMFT